MPIETEHFASKGKLQASETLPRFADIRNIIMRKGHGHLI